MVADLPPQIEIVAVADDLNTGTSVQVGDDCDPIFDVNLVTSLDG